MVYAVSITQWIEPRKTFILFDPNIKSNDEMFDSFPSDSENNVDFVSFEPN